MNTAWKVIALVLLPVLLTEFTELAPWIAGRLTRAAAKRLRDPARTERYTEEWLADVAHCPGKATKMVVSAGHYVASFRLRPPGRHYGTRTAEVRTGRRIVRRGGPPLLTALVALAAWSVTSNVLLEPDRRFLLPSPDAVVREAFLDSDSRTDILSALQMSMLVAAVGLAVAVVTGLGLGILMSRLGWLERAIHPYVAMLGRAPTLALVPLVGFWFDFGLASRIIMVVLVSAPPIVSGAMIGWQGSGGGAPFAHRYGQRRPAALPRVLTSVQTASALAVLASVVGDFFFKQGDPGLGILIDLYRSRLQSEQMFGAAIAAVLLGVIAYWFFGVLAHVAEGGRGDPLVGASTRGSP